MQEELAELRESTDFNDLRDEPKNAPGLAFESSSNTRAHQIHPTDPTKTALVSTTLSSNQEAEVVEFLKSRWKIFAWCPVDMPGIPRELIEHALHVDPTTRPIQQSLRLLSEPKRKAVGKEIQRLTEANFIREIKQSTWVSNPVMVPKKKTDILRMCIDFTYLNKNCPKDHFPLP